MMLHKTYISSAIALALFGTTACGGGGGESGSSAPSDNTPAAVNNSTTINLKAIDGYLENATVCIDLNANNICDDEDITSPQKTDGKGLITLTAEGDKYTTFKNNLSVKVLVVATKDETLNVSLDGSTKTPLEKDLNLTRTIFPADFKNTGGNDSKINVKNITPFTTLADKTGATFASEEDYYNNALSVIATSLGTTLDAIELDFNDPENAKQNKDVIAALLASELLIAENKLDEPIEDLNTFLESQDIKLIKNITESKSEELSNKEEIEEVSEDITNTIETVYNATNNDEPEALFTCDNNEPVEVTVDEDNSYFKASATCNITNKKIPIYIYNWSIDNSDASCKAKSEDPTTYNCEFTKNGNYTVTLIVSDTKGNSSLKTSSIAINDAFKASFNDINQIADSQYSAKDGFLTSKSLNAKFNSTSILPKDRSFEFTFDFGDGEQKVITSSSNPENIAHYYSQPTEYVSKLVIKDTKTNRISKVSNKYTYFRNQICSGSLFNGEHEYTLYYTYYKNDSGAEEFVLVDDVLDTCADKNDTIKTDTTCAQNVIFFYDFNGDESQELSHQITNTTKKTFGNKTYFVSKGSYGALKEYGRTDPFGYYGNHQLKARAKSHDSSETFTYEDCNIEVRIGKNVNTLKYNEVNVGDLINFGEISVVSETGTPNKPSHPIVWEVVAKDSTNNSIMLLQVFDEDSQTQISPITNNTDAKTWKNSPIRSTLNTGFEEEADLAISMPKRSDGNHAIIVLSDNEKKKIIKKSHLADTWHLYNIIEPHCTTNVACVWENLFGASASPVYQKLPSAEGEIEDYLFFLSTNEVTLGDLSNSSISENSSNSESSFKNIISNKWTENTHNTYLLRDMVSMSQCSADYWNSCNFSSESDKFAIFAAANYSVFDNQSNSNISTYKTSHTFNPPYVQYFRLATWIKMEQ